MERYSVHDEYMTPSEHGNVVLYADAQRALDVEREKVKRLSTCGTDHSTPWWQVKCEDLEAQLATLQAQLRQAEGERAKWEDIAGLRFAGDHKFVKEMELLKVENTTLRQLVEALPVLDMRFDSVAVGPLGWTVGGVTFGKVAEANAYSALLQARATLAAKDAKDAPLTDEQRAIRDCCEKPHDCKWGGLGGCGYEGRKYDPPRPTEERS